MSAEEGHVHTVGGALCLDFANTVNGDRDSASAQDRLATYEDLIAWSEGIGSLDPDTAASLRLEAARHPQAAATVLQRAVALREAIYRIFLAQMEQALPSADDVGYLNLELGRALAHLRLEARPAGWTWGWEADAQALEQVVWPIARSAADLLTSGDLARVRQCAGDQCGWLFVDRSKNRSRRWCDMQECGNVAKVRRYRRRQKRAQGHAP